MSGWTDDLVGLSETPCGTQQLAAIYSNTALQVSEVALTETCADI